MKSINILALIFSFALLFLMSSAALAGSSGVFQEGEEVTCIDAQICSSTHLKKKMFIEGFCNICGGSDIKGNIEVTCGANLNISNSGTTLFGNIECCDGEFVFFADGVECKGNVSNCTCTGPGAAACCNPDDNNIDFD